MTKRTVRKRPKGQIAGDTPEHQAAAIVAQVLVHFGAGYGAQRQSETPATALDNEPIFATPKDLAEFFYSLWNGTLKNLDQLDWKNTLSARENATRAAFEHGRLVRQKLGHRQVKFDVIQDTLPQIKKRFCPSVAGAGAVCP